MAQNFSAFMDDENWRERRRQIWWKEGKLSFFHLKKDDIYFKENEKKQKKKFCFLQNEKKWTDLYDKEKKKAKELIKTMLAVQVLF